MRIKSLLCLSIPVLIFSCTPFDQSPGEILSFRPVYSANYAAVKSISAITPRAIVNGGKLYTVGNLLFQVEKDSGIHIIDYADPAHPQKLGFIRSFLCKELAVKDGFIYTNNLADLVVIDINDLQNIREVNRLENAFPDLSLQYPPRDASGSTVYFECPDPSKGIVIGWTQQMITNPKCRR